MEFRQLSYFLAVTESKSMTEAAKKLNVSQPALSTAIKELERELGFPLFERKGKRLEINESGRYVAQRARAVFGILDETEATARNAYEERKRTVNCALGLTLGNAGSRFIKQFSETHPELHVRFGYTDASLFANASVDVKVVGTYQRLDDDQHMFLGKEDFVMALSPEHPLAKAPSVRLADMHDEKFVLQEPCELRTIVDSMFIEAGFEPNVACEAQVYVDALTLAEIGLGCVIAPSVTWLYNHHVNVAVKPIEDVQRRRYLYLEINPNSPSLEASTMFAKEFREYAKTVPVPA